MAVPSSYAWVRLGYPLAFVILFSAGCATPTTSAKTPSPLPSVKKTRPGPRATLTISGVYRSRSLQGKEWDHLTIGMGVADILGQALYDTGCFSLRETNQVVRDHIEKTWNGSASVPASQTDYTASITVERFFLRDVSTFFGIFGAGTKQTIMTVSVTLRNNRSGAIRTSRARGSVRTTNAGALFVFETGTVAFDETTIGRATQQAIYHAVAKLDIP